MHPLEEILKWLPECDFAVFEHGFVKYGRDYFLHIEDCLGKDTGQHEIIFTHCVEANCETAVPERFWQESWGDEFIDYQEWINKGEPKGYVWGTNWSNAYPGIKAIDNSAKAKEWSKKLNKQMYEMNLETDRFLLKIIFHSIKVKKVSNETVTISKVTYPLGVNQGGILATKTFIIDGNNFSDMQSFYDEVEKVLTKDLSWKIGRNLNAFNDILWGGLGSFEHEESIILIWKNSEKSKKELGVANDGEPFFEILIGYIKKKPHIQLIIQ